MALRINGKNKTPSRTASYIRGAAGAFFGALAGASLYFIITIMTKSYLAMSASLIIPLLASLAFVLFSGLWDSSFFVASISISTLFWGILSNLVIQCAYFYQTTLDIVISDGNTNVNLFDMMNAYPFMTALNFYFGNDTLGLFTSEELAALTAEIWITMIVSLVVAMVIIIPIKFVFDNKVLKNKSIMNEKN